ncbi:MAG: hypothetical protein AMXMBFR64_06200 [Myxococcales bacterium]
MQPTQPVRIALWIAPLLLALTACSDPGAAVDPSSAWQGTADSAGGAPSGGTFGGGGYGYGAGSDVAGDDALAPLEDTGEVVPDVLQDVTPDDTPIPPVWDTHEPDVPVTQPEDVGTPSKDTGNGTVLPTCGEDEVTLEKPKVPATVLIVMDRSGSMEGTNWEQTKAAVAEVLEVHGPYINFGLLLFPPKSGGGCVLPAKADVGFALNNGPAIVDVMEAAGTGGGTPTGGALQAALQVVNQANPAGERIVIVATDGKPNCAIDCGKCGCAFGCDFLCFNEDQCAEDEVFTAVSSLVAKQTKVYVIGITGSSGAKKVLNKMAEIGGTAQAGDPKYYDTANGADLVAALDAIAGSVGSCSVPLQIPPGTAFIALEIDGEKVLKDPTHTDGWDLLEGDVMQLYGAACEAATKEGAKVEVTYICKYKQ